METDQHPGLTAEAQLAVEERQSFAARIGNTARSGYEHVRGNIERYAALGGTVLALAGANVARMAAFSPESVAAEDPVTLNSSESNESSRQACIDIALKRPRAEAYMIRPGREVYKPNGAPQPAQTITLGAIYPDVSSACGDSFKRVGKARAEVKGENGWRKLDGYGWTIGVNGNEKYPIFNLVAPIGHEADWFYWHKGSKFRALFVNRVVSMATSKVIAKKSSSIPIHIGPPKHKLTY